MRLDVRSSNPVYVRKYAYFVKKICTSVVEGLVVVAG